MDRHLAEQIQAMIRKHVPSNTAGREALVYNAWMGSPLLEQVTYEGNKYEFSTHLYMRGTLYGSLRNGEHALAALLTAIADRGVGAEDQDQINHLLLRLSQLKQPARDNRQHDVFLSYARENSDAMAQIKAALQAEGIRVWTDDDLAIGTPNWVSEIDANLRAAGAIVVLCSPAANQSQWVREEWLMAQRLELGIFPVLLAGDGFPFGLQSRQGIDGRGVDLNTLAHEKLIPALAIYLGVESASSVRQRLDTQAAEAAQAQAKEVKGRTKD